MPSGGMMIPSTTVVTILPNAAPITTATARSMTLPRAMNSRKSFSMPDSLFDRGAGAEASEVRILRARGGAPVPRCLQPVDRSLILLGHLGREPQAHRRFLLVRDFDVGVGLELAAVELIEVAGPCPAASGDVGVRSCPL